ncbi:hypothetical protein EBU94_00325 [bacterium]|nr:hypothetical protein [bacterium]
MRHIKTFQGFLNESSGNTLTVDDIKKMTGFTAVEEEYQLDPEVGYTSVQSFTLNVPGVDKEYPLQINIYDGNMFSFFQDAAPIALSIHTPAEKREIQQSMIEVPSPLSVLSKKIIKEVVKEAKEYGNY